LAGYELGLLRLVETPAGGWLYGLLLVCLHTHTHTHTHTFAMSDCYRSAPQT